MNAEQQIDLFLKELVELTDGLDDKSLKNMTFKSLYDKYPKVRIGLRRALYILEKKKECTPP